MKNVVSSVPVAICRFLFALNHLILPQSRFQTKVLIYVSQYASTGTCQSNHSRHRYQLILPKNNQHFPRSPIVVLCTSRPTVFQREYNSRSTRHKHKIVPTQKIPIKLVEEILEGGWRHKPRSPPDRRDTWWRCICVFRQTYCYIVFWGRTKRSWKIETASFQKSSWEQRGWGILPLIQWRIWRKRMWSSLSAD